MQVLILQIKDKVKESTGQYKACTRNLRHTCRTFLFLMLHRHNRYQGLNPLHLHIHIILYNRIVLKMDYSLEALLHLRN